MNEQLPSQTQSPKAFISHSSQDHKFVEKFAADLRAHGVDAWYAGWDIKPGDSIRKRIDDALGACEYFVIVLSKKSVSSRWVQVELDTATVRSLDGRVKRIIPIRIEDCDGIPPTLASLCWEDFSVNRYELALKRVLDAIFDVDAKPPLRRPTAKRFTSEILPTPDCPSESGEQPPPQQNWKERTQQERRPSRVQWMESTEMDYPRLIIADREGDSWRFYDKEFSEVRWYPLKATRQLIDKANHLYQYVS